jgi:Ni2+-binding GTPase involved in maturation of urease and hydrogenase
MPADLFYPPRRDTPPPRLEITVSGPPGSGKTLLIEAIKQVLATHTWDNAVEAFHDVNGERPISIIERQTEEHPTPVPSIDEDIPF